MLVAESEPVAPGDVADEDVDARVGATSECIPIVERNSNGVASVSGGALCGTTTGLPDSSGQAEELVPPSGSVVEVVLTAPAEVVPSRSGAGDADTATVTDEIILRSEQLRGIFVGTGPLKKGLRYITLSGLSNTANLYKVEAIPIWLIQFGVAGVLDCLEECGAEVQYELACLTKGRRGRRRSLEGTCYLHTRTRYQT